MSPRTFVARSAAILSLAALGLAACESKTIVTPQVIPVSIVVSPASVTLTAAGQKAQFVAVVTAPSDQAQTYTWSSSNTAVATVDANGVVTAVANGTASIIATATADASKKAAGLVTVQIPVVVPPQVIPATISIQQVTDNRGRNVNLQNVFGQINVALNVDPGQGNTISKVETLIDGVAACSQSFTQGSSAQVGVEATNAPVTIVCSINTAALTAAGVSIYTNGAHQITARLVAPNGTVVANPATETFVFANTNMVGVTFTAAKTATDAAGLLWNGGNLTVTLTPSIFDTQVLQTVTVSVYDYNNGLTATKVVTMNGNTPATVTFRADSAAPNGVQNFEYSSTWIQATSSVTKAGQEFNGSLGSVSLRLDNKAPVITAGEGSGQPTFKVNTVGGTTWLSKANDFKTACTAVSAGSMYFNCQLGSTVLDEGVDVVKATFQITNAPSGSSSTWTSVTGFADLSNTVANAKDSRLQFCDNLGNCSTSNKSGAFGVDLTPPIIQAVTDISGVKAAPQTLSVAAIDSLSGFDLVNGFLSVQITKDSAKSDGSDVKSCVNGSTGATSALPSSGTCGFVVIPGATGTFTIPAGTNGYFTVVMKTTDIAGNETATVSRFFLMDAVAPTISGLGVSYTTGAATIGVNGTVNDNVDIKQYAAYETFAGAVAGATAIPFAPPTTVKAYGIPVNGKVTATATVPTILGIQAGFGGALNNATGFGFGGMDQASNFNIGYVALGLTSAAVSATDVVVANNVFSVNNANVCAAADPADCASGDKTSTTPKQVIVMNNTTTANPIVKVYFYRVDATGIATYLSEVATPAPEIPSSGANQNLRVFTYTGPTVAANVLTVGANTFFAVGVDKNGNGVLLGSAAVTAFLP